MDKKMEAASAADAVAPGPFPRSVEEIFEDHKKRKAGLVKGLTEDSEELYKKCDPSKDNLMLYGNRDGTWSVVTPAEEVPPELPEPCLGINFARDGMSKKDWIALLAVHSDSWLMSVAFFYAVRLDGSGRMRLFKQINEQPTIFESVTGRGQVALDDGPSGKKMRVSSMAGRPTQSEQPSGRILRPEDLGPQLKGRQAEMYWPDDGLWYLVEIQSINLKTKQAKVIYATGEEEDVDMEEIVRDQQMALLT